MQALLDVLGITFDFSWVMSVGQILMNYIVNNKYHHLSPSILGDYFVLSTENNDIVFHMCGRHNQT